MGEKIGMCKRKRGVCWCWAKRCRGRVSAPVEFGSVILDAKNGDVKEEEGSVLVVGKVW
jgi:hypothetical protein